MTYKRCTQCLTDKPLDDYYRDCRQKDGRTSACRVCDYERRKARRPKRSTRIVPHAEYLRLRQEQDGRCAICGATDEGQPVGLNVDHDHETGEVRGLLCRSCNLGLGFFADSSERLRAAALYLLAEEKRSTSLN